MNYNQISYNGISDGQSVVVYNNGVPNSVGGNYNRPPPNQVPDYSGRQPENMLIPYGRGNPSQRSIGFSGTLTDNRVQSNTNMNYEIGFSRNQNSFPPINVPQFSTLPYSVSDQREPFVLTEPQMTQEQYANSLNIINGMNTGKRNVDFTPIPVSRVDQPSDYGARTVVVQHPIAPIFGTQFLVPANQSMMQEEVQPIVQRERQQDLIVDYSNPGYGMIHNTNIELVNEARGLKNDLFQVSASSEKTDWKLEQTFEYVREPTLDATIHNAFDNYNTWDIRELLKQMRNFITRNNTIIQENCKQNNEKMIFGECDDDIKKKWYDIYRLSNILLMSPGDFSDNIKNLLAKTSPGFVKELASVVIYCLSSNARGAVRTMLCEVVKYMQYRIQIEHNEVVQQKNVETIKELTNKVNELNSRLIQNERATERLVDISEKCAANLANMEFGVADAVGQISNRIRKDEDIAGQMFNSLRKKQEQNRYLINQMFLAANNLIENSAARDNDALRRSLLKQASEMIDERLSTTKDYVDRNIKTLSGNIDVLANTAQNAFNSIANRDAENMCRIKALDSMIRNVDNRNSERAKETAEIVNANTETLQGMLVKMTKVFNRIDDEDKPVKKPRKIEAEKKPAFERKSVQEKKFNTLKRDFSHGTRKDNNVRYSPEITDDDCEIKGRESDAEQIIKNIPEMSVLEDASVFNSTETLSVFIYTCIDLPDGFEYKNNPEVSKVFYTALFNMHLWVRLRAFKWNDGEKGRMDELFHETKKGAAEMVSNQGHYKDLEEKNREFRKGLEKLAESASKNFISKGDIDGKEALIRMSIIVLINALNIVLEDDGKDETAEVQIQIDGNIFRIRTSGGIRSSNVHADLLKKISALLVNAGFLEEAETEFKSEEVHKGYGRVLSALYKALARFKVQ